MRPSELMLPTLARNVRFVNEYWLILSQSKAGLHVPDMEFESLIGNNGAMYVVGIDEVGRGAVAGPAAVGAVCLAGEDPHFLVDDLLAQASLRRLADSKQMTRQQRERAFSYLENRISWAVGLSEAKEIDALGISPALRLAAGRALDGIRARGLALAKVEADASLFHPYEAELPTSRTVKGDETILEITLASIMAKVWRDRLMAELAASYPVYGWERNAGYGTAAHLAALREASFSPQHRLSFLSA